MSQDHPVDDELKQFLDGKLSRERSSVVEQHLQQCERCSTTLASIATLTPLVTAVRECLSPVGELTTDRPVATHDSVLRAEAVRGEQTTDYRDPATGEYANPEDHRTGEYDHANSTWSRMESTGEYGNPSSSTQHGLNRKAGDDDFELANTGERRTVTDRLSDYKILSELGHGGMGVVYKAIQKKLNRTVALKMVLAGARAKPSTLVRFRSEAQAVAKLDHPNVVQIYDVGEHDDLPFFSMEFVDGGSLESKMDNKPMEPQPAARLMVVVARGMHYAHQKQVVHRDLKPANILITRDGVPKITDFGLARQLDGSDDASAGTKTGAIMGTPNYMAPEQAEGNTKYADHLADVYSLGATLYTMLTGRPPFAGPSVASVLSQVRDSDPVPPTLLQPNLPKDIQTIVLKCLQKDPSKRYPSAAELADDLERFLDGRSIIARPVSSLEHLIRWCRRKKGQAAATFAALALGIGFVVSLVVYNVQLTDKNRQILQQRDDLEVANIRVVQELNASQKTGDATYQMMRGIRRSILPELNRLGMSRQKSELMGIIARGMEQIERASPEGVKGLERNRILYLLDIAEQYASDWFSSSESRSERLAKAEKYLDDAAAIGEEIAGRAGAGDLPRANLALVLANRGVVRRIRGNPTGADADLQRSLEINQQIVDAPISNAQSPDYIFPANAKRSLAMSHYIMGIDLLKDATSRESVREHFRLGMALANEALKMVQADPNATYDGDGSTRFRQVAATLIVANAALNLEEAMLREPIPNTTNFSVKLKPAPTAAALSQFREATAVYPTILLEFEGFDRLSLDRVKLAKLLFGYGYTRFKAEAIREAKEIWEWSENLLRPALAGANDQDKLAIERDVALLLYGIGSAELRLKSQSKAMTAFADCVSIRRRIFAADPSSANTWTLMVSLARQGRAAEAIRLLERELEQQDKPSRQTDAASFWFQAACTYSLSAEMLGGLQDDATPRPDDALTPELKNLRSVYLHQATEAAKKVEELKSPRARSLSDDPDLAFWRSRTRK